MNRLYSCNGLFRVRLVARLLAAGILFSLFAAPGLAEDKPAGRAVRMAGPGCLLERSADGATWTFVKPASAVREGALLVGLSNVDLDSKNGAIRLELAASLMDDTPVEETAVVLHANPDVDIDFTLDRGQVHLINRKKSGSAHARVRFDKAFWDVYLDEPGDECAMLLFGRHLPGVKAFNQDDKDSEPLVQVALLVLKGEVHIKHNALQHKLTAPPGPALFHWDSKHGDDARPRNVEKVPDIAKLKAPSKAPQYQQAQAAVRLFVRRLQAAPVNEVLREAIASDDANYRRVGVFAMSALDDLPGVADALNDVKHPDLRDAAVGALRHWIGRGPGQDAKLYKQLIEKRGLTPTQAKAALQLLHSFDESNLERPETYELLIAYLDHPALGARELARWHLYRLVPAGKNIAYDANAPTEERKKAIQKWTELIPEGKLPPKAKGEDTKRES